MSQPKVRKNKHSDHKNGWKQKLSIALVLTGVIFAGLVFWNYQEQQQMEQRREAMMAQRQVLIDKWKEDGLTDEEIKDKLNEEGVSLRSGNFQPSPLRRALFTIRRMTGNDPRDGSGRGAGLGGPGRGQ